MNLSAYFNSIWNLTWNLLSLSWSSNRNPSFVKGFFKMFVCRRYFCIVVVLFFNFLNSRLMILWIDPGVRKLWFALINRDLTILDAWILLQESKNVTREIYFHRIVEIVKFFRELLVKYPAIKTVSIEKLFFTASNQSNAEFVYGVRGALIALFVEHGCQIVELTPIELKKYVTGNGKAEKLLVQCIVMKLFHLENMPEYNDAADALGLAFVASKFK